MGKSRGATSRKRDGPIDFALSARSRDSGWPRRRVLAGRDEGRAPFSSTTSATPIRRYAQATLTLNKQHRLDDAPATNTNTNTHTKRNDEAHGRCSRAPRGRRLVRRHGRRVECPAQGSPREKWRSARFRELQPERR